MASGRDRDQDRRCADVSPTYRPSEGGSPRHAGTASVRQPGGAAPDALMRKLFKDQGFAPKLLVTDKLRFYASAFR